MKRSAVSGCAALLLSGLMHAQLSVPQLGFARFSDGSVHAVRGIVSNLIVDPRALLRADKASFSDSGGLTSTNGLIRLLNAKGAVLGEYASGEPLPLLNIDSSLRSAVVWLPSKHALLRWDGAAFTATPVDESSFGGAVTFVRLASAKTAELFVELADLSVAKLSVSLAAPRSIGAEAEPGVKGAIFVQRDWMLSTDGQGLMAELPNGDRQTIDLSAGPLPAGDLTIERMASDWLHISSRSTGVNWAVYLSSTKLSVSLLPPPAREAAK
jgi:hypothetical protein